MQSDNTSNRDLSVIFWTITAIILSFLCLAHLGVLVCFVFKAAVSPFVAPAALLIALAIGYWLAGREGLEGIPRILPPAMALAVVAI
jgi:hypothetical protein